MKLAMFFVFAALVGFGQNASAQEVHNCKGKTFFGEVIKITVTYEEETEKSIEIEYVDERGKVKTDSGKADDESSMKDFLLKKNSDYRVIFTTQAILDEEGRHLRKVQIKDLNSMFRYNFVFCAEQEEAGEGDN